MDRHRPTRDLCWSEDVGRGRFRSLAAGAGWSDYKKRCISNVIKVELSWIPTLLSWNLTFFKLNLFSKKSKKLDSNLSCYKIQLIKLESNLFQAEILLRSWI